MTDDSINRAMLLIFRVHWVFAVFSVIGLGFGCYFIFESNWFAILAFFMSFSTAYLFVFARWLIKTWSLIKNNQNERFNKWKSDTDV